MMVDLALMAHILNKIFKMKYETHAFGIEKAFKKTKWKIKQIEIHFENWF